MTSTDPSRKRCFSAAARAAALAARQAKALLPKGDGIEVFAIRPMSYANIFGWEIRRFGGVVVDRGDGPFPTPEEALAEGQRALARQARVSKRAAAGGREARVIVPEQTSAREASSSA